VVSAQAVFAQGLLVIHSLETSFLSAAARTGQHVVPK